MKWRKLLARKGVDLVTISEIDLVFFKLLNEYPGNYKGQLFTFSKKKLLEHYTNVDIQEVGRFVYQKYFNSKKVIQDYYQQGIDLTKKFEQEAVKWKKSSDLSATFEKYKELFKEVCWIHSIVSWWAIEAWQNDYEKVLTKLIKKASAEEKQDQIMDCLCKPWKETSLIEIQNKLSSGASVQELAQEYQFLRSWVAVWYNHLDESWFKSIEKSQQTESMMSKEEAIALLKPNQEELEFIEIAPYIIFFKDWRDDVRRKFVYTWHFIFDKIAEHYDLDFNDLGYLTTDEISLALKENKFPLETISARKEKGCVVTCEENEVKIKVYDIIPENFLQIMERVEDTSTSQEIKGMVAHPGKVVGPVRIMSSYHDLKRVEPGDILVANTTHPNYLPAMQKAAAFVTNEGGVVSHAAIVAREMKKPCIVGTKIATKVLQDNDLVEVDADQGIVKKITS
jgi:phosphohistidine swiveling domain-containing protein